MYTYLYPAIENSKYSLMPIIRKKKSIFFYIPCVSFYIYPQILQCSSHLNMKPKSPPLEGWLSDLLH